MTETVEQQLAALLRALRPAPPAWVTAACEIPRIERELEHPPDLSGTSAAAAERDTLPTTAGVERETGPASDR
jgi:hypothetical protein